MARAPRQHPTEPSIYRYSLCEKSPGSSALLIGAGRNRIATRKSARLALRSTQNLGSVPCPDAQTQTGDLFSLEANCDTPGDELPGPRFDYFALRRSGRVNQASSSGQSSPGGKKLVTRFKRDPNRKADRGMYYGVSVHYPPPTAPKVVEVSPTNRELSG